MALFRRDKDRRLARGRPLGQFLQSAIVPKVKSVIPAIGRSLRTGAERTLQTVGRALSGAGKQVFNIAQQNVSTNPFVGIGTRPIGVVPQAQALEIRPEEQLGADVLGYATIKNFLSKSRVEFKREDVIEEEKPVDQLPALSQFPQAGDEENIAQRHNNPGNLVYLEQEGSERGEEKLDENGQPTGLYWARFNTPQEGWDALIADDNKKISDEPNVTLRELISTRSPKEENELERLIDDISLKLGVSSYVPVSELDPRELAAAIAQFEGWTASK